MSDRSALRRRLTTRLLDLVEPVAAPRSESRKWG
jgi:hypothetical protein